MAPTRSKGGSAKRGRGRPPGSRTSVATKKRVPKPVAAKEKITRKRSSQSSAKSRTIRVDNPAKSSPRRKRKAEAEPDEIAEEQPKTQKYVQLAPRTRRIAQETINTWPQVSTLVLDQIVGVLKDAKNDIVNTQRDSARTTLADNTLSGLVRLLQRQLSASRIPPQAKDIHFNNDKLTERNAQVFREVTTARHSKQLLKEQAKVAEQLLQQDEENLDQLKKNVKKWKAEWKHQEKHGRVHPLLQGSEDVETVRDRPDDIGLKRSTPGDHSMLESPDPELAPVLEQLRKSLENMQGNHAQVEGIGEAMQNAQAALDDVLFKHASAQQYDAL